MARSAELAAILRDTRPAQAPGSFLRIRMECVSRFSAAPRVVAGAGQCRRIEGGRRAAAIVNVSQRPHGSHGGVDLTGERWLRGLQIADRNVRPCERALVDVLRQGIAGGAGVPGRLDVVTQQAEQRLLLDRKSTRLNSSHSQISYAVFCLKK